MTPQQSAVHGAISRFPNTASKTLARVLFKESSALFRTLDCAYTAVRRARGVQGEFNRKRASDKTAYRALQAPGDAFGKIPEGLTHFEEWQAVKVAGPHSALVISDLHIPYHDRRALVAALEYGRKRNPSLIFLNGDIADFFSVSFWQKDPRKRDLALEVKAAREFMQSVRYAFRKARIIYKIGNHEERWERYLECKAPEILGMEEFTIEAVLKLADVGAECIGDKRPVMLGDLPIIHGHEYNFAISNPVNPARGFFLRAQTHCLGGHLHQTSQHSATNLQGKTISTWSTGCLCDLHPDYRPLNCWNHGFAFVEVDKSGAFRVDNLRIINGQIW